MRFIAAILAGGESRRMGRDKASLPSLENDSITFLQRTIHLAAQATEATLVIGRTNPQKQPLQGVFYIPDDNPGQGPAGGLSTALRWVQENSPAENVSVLALSCDMPLLSQNSLDWIGKISRENPGRDGICVLNDERLEPLFSVYRLSCRELLDKRLEMGKRSLIGLLDEGDFYSVNLPQNLSSELHNVNSEDDLLALKEPGDKAELRKRKE